MSTTAKSGSQSRTVSCALLVLLAISSLTISVATRYSSDWNISARGVNTVHAHTTALGTKRQRLAKNSGWVPPTFNFTISQAPEFIPRFTSSGPTVVQILFEEDIYSRPPPRI
jgi:hypothetical protein